MKYEIMCVMFLLFMINQGCRTHKEGSYAQNRQEVLLNGQSFVQWHHSDSTTRYWYYQNDSSFYFHPDSGLFGTSGWLAVRESQFRSQHVESRKDTSTYLLEEHAVGSYKKESESGPSSLWWYVLGVGIIFTLVWFVKKS